ncbi:hypothetical protein KUTeg_010069 [Tegillarca granosa]|uniref:Uncharacterized protein n=1 Tax=Tegillarca granosa TaxID=220873 RepID=A0ABQ9F5R3_TEGGR|nr:hypothetical protein KUTeg_010069 [Tegillarca granosa]
MFTVDKILQEFKRFKIVSPKVPSENSGKMSSQTNKNKFSINQLKERFLECGICQEEYNEGSKTPRLLPCLHTLCSDCLRRLVHNNVIECPFCRSNYQLNTTQDVEDYPKDNTRRDLLQFVGEDLNIICKVCEDKSKAKYRCRNCADFLCEQCYRAHRRTKYTKEHKVLRIEELKSDPEMFKDFIYEGFCAVPGHETVPLKLYCAAKECCKPICYNCAVSEHRDPTKHPVQNIVDVYEDKKLDLEKNLEDLKSTRKEMLEKKEHVDKEVAKVQPTLERVDEDIEKAFGDCIKLLEFRKSYLKEEAKVIIAKKRNQLEQQSGSYRDYIERLDTGIQFTEETLIYKDVAGLLEIEDTINKRLQNLQGEKLEGEPKTNAQLQFQPTKMSTDFESFCSRMGSISSTEAYPPNTKINVPQQVQVGKESTISISLYTVTGEPVVFKNIGLAVEITDNDGNLEKPPISYHKEQISIKLTPMTAGIYHIAIRALGGKLLLGKTEFEVQQYPELVHNQDRKADVVAHQVQQTQIGENRNAELKVDKKSVFGVTIDVTKNELGQNIEYKYQERTIKRQRILTLNKCTNIKTILDLLHQANGKGLLFQKTEKNEIIWNQVIPFKEIKSDVLNMNHDFTDVSIIQKINKKCHYQNNLISCQLYVFLIVQEDIIGLEVSPSVTDICINWKKKL